METVVCTGRGPNGTPQVLTINADNELLVTMADGGNGDGGVGSDYARLVAHPTISYAMYAAGDALGGAMEFTGATQAGVLRGIIRKIVLIDESSQNAPIDIVFFNQTFTATADSAPFNPSNADLQNCLGFVDIAATDYSAFAGNAIATKASGLRMPFPYILAAGTSLYAQMVVRGAPTYVPPDEITVILTVERYDE
jgi:hypothetical protein